MNLTKKSKKGWVFFILFSVSILSKAQYCVPQYAQGCSAGDYIQSFNFLTISNTTGSTCISSYNDYTSIGTASVTPLQSYDAYVGNGPYGAGVRIWIDFNDNLIFESNESLGSADLSASSTGTILIYIPQSATSGTHRMRVRHVYNAVGSTIDPCSNYTYGETEDYQVYVNPLPPCTTTPDAGFAIANPSLTCINIPISLGLAASSIESGITYQWQKSTDFGSTWSNLGSLQNTYAYTIPSQSVTTQYRCILSCLNGGTTDTSSAVPVNQTPLTNCYCSPSFMECGIGEYIQSLDFAGMSDPTINCVPNGFEDRSYTVTTPTLNAGQTYSYSINISNTSGWTNNRLAYWLDANQNAIFENFEYGILSTSPATFANVSGNILIPGYALGGQTKIRFKYENDGGSINGNDACSSNGYYGVTLDYVLNIIAAPSCTGTPTAGNAFSSESSVCENVPYDLNLNGTSIASGLTFQWQTSSNGTSGWTNIGSNEIYPNFSVSSQTATTFYRNIVTCANSGLSSNSSTISVNQNPFNQCYCTPNSVSCEFAHINDLSFANLSNTVTCNLSSGTNSSTLTANVNANQTYTFSANVTGGGDFAYVGLWIDYDQNGAFDQYEFNYIDSSCCSSVTNSVNIPFTAKGGLTGMRVLLIRDYSSIEIPYFDPCYTNFGEAQYLNYFVNITPVPSCSATPNAGITVSTKTLVCSSDAFELNLAGNSINSGIAYQWQSSNNNSTWTNLSSTQSHVNYSVSAQNSNTYYRCITTCLASSQTSTSTPIMVTQKALNQCYCIPENVVCSSGAGTIENVTIDGLLNNNSVCSLTDAYTDYTQTVPVATLSPGNSYSVSVTTTNNSNENAGAWIDYDKNGYFDDYEFFYIGNSYGNYTMYNTFTVPTSASSGLTRMRVRVLSSASVNSSDACDKIYGDRINPNLPQTISTMDGETEDYSVFITLPNCTLVNTPPFIDASITSSVVCYGDETVLDITPQMPNATGYTYDWLYSTDGSNYSPAISGNTTSSLSVVPGENYYYICTVSCNSNTVITTTNPATVIVNTTTLNISSPSASICPGQTITLTASGATSYTWGTGAQTETISINPLTTTSYSVSGTGLNGCIGSSVITVTVGLASNIQGTVTSSGIPVTGGVILFKYEPMLTKFDTAGVQAIAANGSYNFPSVLYGSYIVMAVPTATNLQVTYGLNAVGWKDATIINHACVNDDVQNINVVPFLTIGTGPGLMSGQIVEGIGFGQKPNGPLVPTAPGNPIGGIIVKGGKNPGGNFFTQTVTDASGNYTLAALPINNPGEEYFILVDIPGLDTNGTYERRITSLNNVFTGLNFVVGSQKIDTIADVSVQSINYNSVPFKVYPNPANDKFTIKFTAISDSDTKIELVDIIGRKVETVFDRKIFKLDTYDIDVNTKNIQSGIYFLRIDSDGNIQTIKLIITH